MKSAAAILEKDPIGVARAAFADAVDSAALGGLETANGDLGGTPASASWWHAVRKALVLALGSSAGNAAQHNALGVFSVRIASAAFLFLSQVALARWMGAADYGVFVSLWTAVLVLGGLSHLGLNMAMMRLVPQYFASGAFALLRGLLLGGRLLAVAMGAAVAALGAIALWLADGHFGTGFVATALLALICLPLYALSDVQDGIGRGQGWTFEGIVPPYLVRPLLMLLLVGGASLANVAPSASMGMAAAWFATAGAAALQTYLIQRRVTQAVPRGPLQLDFPGWLTISLPLLAVGACELVLQNADVLLLNLFRSPNEIGVYYAATKTAGLALFVHYAVGSAYAGRVASARARGDEAGVRRLVAEAVRWTFYPSLAVTALVLAAGYPLLAQFGTGFADAYPLMFIFAAGVMARAAAGPSEFVLNMLGQQRACAVSFAAAAAVSVALNVVLVPLWGVTGASVATASALSTAAFLNWLAARRLIGIDMFVFAKVEGERPARAFPRPYFQTLAGTRAPAVPPAGIDGGPATDLAFEVVRDAVRFEALEREWNDLYQRAGASAQLFQRFDWSLTWVRHFLPADGGLGGMRLAVVVGRRDGKVQVIWPLVTKRFAGMTHLMWMGDPVSQYGDVLVERGEPAPEILRQSWRFIVSDIAPDVVNLRRVRADASIAPLLFECGALVTRRQLAPYIDVSGAKDFAAFEQRYPARARKNRRRLLRRLEEKGAVAFVHIAGGAPAEKLALEAIELKRIWLDDRGLASTALRDERTRDFFAEAVRGTGGSSCCRVSAITLDGAPCAIMVFVAAGKRFAGHVFAYDLAHQKAGVGVLLLEDCIRWAIESGYEILDFLAPGDAYKLDWTDDAVEVCDWARPLSLGGQAFTRLYLKFAREHIKRTAEGAPLPIRKMVLAACYRRGAG